MLYKVGQHYLNLDEVESVIADKSGDPKFPYALTINMKSGHNVTRWYASEAVRDSTAAEVARLHSFAYPGPVTRYELDTVVNKEVSKVRNDVRTIKKLLLEVLEHGRRNSE